jgi:cytochrome c oxidase subunit 2
MKEWFGEKILGLPQLASSNGRGVDDLIIYVHWLMLALFIGWTIYFLYAIRRFRSSRHPKADYHGVRSHASNYLEVGVALVEAVLLIFVAVPIWARNVSQLPSPGESTVIQVVAQQFAWNVRYAGPDGVFGRQDMKFVARTMCSALTRPMPAARTTYNCSTKFTCPSTNRSSFTSVRRTWFTR